MLSSQSNTIAHRTRFAFLFEVFLFFSFDILLKREAILLEAPFSFSFFPFDLLSTASNHGQCIDKKNGLSSLC